MRGQIRGAARAMSQAVRLAGRLLASPRTGGGHLRRAAALILDEQFSNDSPLREVDSHLLTRILRHEVILPPPSLRLPGNQSHEGLVFLASLAISLDTRTVFEIGTYNGLTAWCLARNVPAATVYTLDLPVEQTPLLPLFEKDPSNRRSFDQRIYEVLPAEGRVVPLSGDSANFHFDSWHSRCDLVYIDGAHSRPYVESDTNHALEMLSPAGAIVWDDYWRGVPDVADVLNQRNDIEIWRVPGTRLAIYLTEAARTHLRTHS
jgi:predicted O-methyltransferase YrrM